mgnify:CR=1 FL=1
MNAALHQPASWRAAEAAPETAGEPGGRESKQARETGRLPSPRRIGVHRRQQSLLLCRLEPGGNGASAPPLDEELHQQRTHPDLAAWPGTQVLGIEFAHQRSSARQVVPHRRLSSRWDGASNGKAQVMHRQPRWDLAQSLPDSGRHPQQRAGCGAHWPTAHFTDLAASGEEMEHVLIQDTLAHVPTCGEMTSAENGDAKSAP